jgi:tetratricopeptide (TPR) repeat protein
MEIFPTVTHQGMEDISLLPNSTTPIPNKDAFPLITLLTGSGQLSQVTQLRQAQQLIQAGNYEEAVTVLTPLFEDPPGNWEPWFWMGTALLGQDDLELAEHFFLSGLARNDKIPQLWIQRALVAHQQGAYQLAIHELQRAEFLNPSLPHTHLNMGYAYENLGHIGLANEYYDKFLKLSEGNPAFFSTRKKLYARFTEQVHVSPRTDHFNSRPDMSHHTRQQTIP